MFSSEKMNWTRTFLFFGIPGLLMAAGVYWLVPPLINLGIPLIVAWTFAVWGPVVLLFIVILSNFLRQPGRERFAKRFRFRKMTRKEWLWTLGAFIVIQALEMVLAGTGGMLARYPLFAPPAVLPDLFNPAFHIEEGLTRLMGVPLKGNAWLIGFWLLWVVINIGGEEILWRGFALPLQEKAFGKYAWLVNGLCWNVLIHFFFRWNLITLMPISLLLPFLVQKFGNTWIGVIIHGTGNLLLLIILIPEML